MSMKDMDKMKQLLEEKKSQSNFFYGEKKDWCRKSSTET